MSPLPTPPSPLPMPSNEHLFHLQDEELQQEEEDGEQKNNETHLCLDEAVSYFGCSKTFESHSKKKNIKRNFCHTSDSKNIDPSVIV